MTRKHWKESRYGSKMPTDEHPEAARPERVNDLRRAVEELRRSNAGRRRRPQEREGRRQGR